MKNLSLFSISLNKLYNDSPNFLINSKIKLNLNNVFFSNVFSNLIVIKSIKNFEIYHSEFNSFLKTVIIISNNYENIDYCSRFSFLNEINTNIQSCVFRNLDSNEQGSAIFINNNNINITLFYNSFIK